MENISRGDRGHGLREIESAEKESIIRAVDREGKEQLNDSRHDKGITAQESSITLLMIQNPIHPHYISVRTTIPPPRHAPAPSPCMARRREI